MITSLRTALFFIGWIAFTAIAGFIALPALLSRRATWSLAHIWCAITLGWLRIACNIRTTVLGQEHIPTQGGLVASKHQSAWDTLVLWRTLKNPAFIMKRELYYIPVFGWYLWRAGMIAIDRSAGRTALDSMIAGAKRARAEQRSIVIFPEGTRVPAGQERALKSGVARISHALNIAVTPAALNAGRFWPKGTLRKFPGEAVVKFLSPIAPCGDDLNSWLAQLQTAINQECRAIGG